MRNCKNCGTCSMEGAFCENCGMKLDDNFLLNEKKKGRTVFWVGSGVASILLVSYVALGMGGEKEADQETVAVHAAVDPNEEIIAREETDAPASEAALDVESVLEEMKEESVLTYHDIDILGKLANGSLMGSLHLGSTREELINAIGPAIVEYDREGEFRLDYSDATYYFSPNNGLVYSVLLLLYAETTSDFEQIRSVFEGKSHLQADSGKDGGDDYYLALGSEDSTITFYSENESGLPIYKIIYTNLSIYTANTATGSSDRSKHPGEVEPLILQIRKEYHAINEQLPSMKTVEDSSGRMQYQNAKGNVRKIVEKNPEGSVEYYYDGNQDLIFVFQYKGTIENRFYFFQNQQIRWITPDRVTIDYDAGQSNTEYKNWEAHWMEGDY